MRPLSPADGERFWLFLEAATGLLKWYARGDLRGLKASRNAIVKLMDGFALSLELLEVSQAESELPLDGEPDAP